MFDPQDPDPASTALAGASAVPPEFVIEACNFGLSIVLLTNGMVVPIVLGLLRSGETCEADDPRLYCFVCGSDETGWQWSYRAEFNQGHTNH